MLQVCLNGARSRGEHAGLPVTAAELATAAQASVAAGADDILPPADDVDTLLAALAGLSPILLHGQDAVAWPVLRRAQALGLDTRIGLEDTLTLPDGSPAPDNASLVRAALQD